ncbi:MAG: PKD domain-containing protein [Dehalococcoidia bacterium]|nr:PKD domain-containing protein [Dehalococcoidia bacterium]
MAKARLVAVLIAGFLIVAALAPGVALSAEPSVANKAPYNGATDIMLMPVLECTYTANPDIQLASWWQIATDSAFTTLVWNTGITIDSNLQLEVPRGYLQPGTTYYWRVKVQDVVGYWSSWSETWSFTTASSFVPDQPENLSPADDEDEISPDQKLQASAFYDGDGDGHYASQWQVTATSGSYGSPLFDSSIDTGNKTQISLPAGLVDYGKTYYWHVRYQSDRGEWSPWSDETSFTVVDNSPPGSPQNVSPADGATGVSTRPVLQASAFSDPDATAYIALTDSHAASQWQIRLDTGTYASPVVNATTGAVTSVVITEQLEAGKTYYWHVRYQDSRGNWSGYSEETSFTVKSIPVPVASFTADRTDVVLGRDLVTFTDNSTPAAEISSWAWDFGDGTTETWTYDTRPPNGKITHKYAEAPETGNTYTVTLTVYNAAATSGVAYTQQVVIHGVPEASFTVSAAPKAGKEITFTDTSTYPSDIQSWEWTFDDGITETWTASTRPADGKIKHTFKKGGEHTVTLTVKGTGDLGESFYNKKISVKGAGGFQFGLWMIAVGVGVVVVIAGAVYLIRSRKATAAK